MVEADRWLSTMEEFVSCLVEALNKQRPVLSKAGRVNSFNPELSSKVRLTEHRSCSFNQCKVASFSNSIFLRCSDGREVLRDSFLLKELIKGAVFELSFEISSFLSGPRGAGSTSLIVNFSFESRTR